MITSCESGNVIQVWKICAILLICGFKNRATTMSNEQQDGGPAYPTADIRYANGSIQYGKSGMALRDWFAGQALAGIAESSSKVTSIVIATQCYLLADAMLVARTKQQIRALHERNEAREKLVKVTAQRDRLAKAMKELIAMDDNMQNCEDQSYCDDHYAYYKGGYEAWEEARKAVNYKPE